MYTSTPSSRKQKSPLLKLVPTMSNHTNSWKNEGRICGRDFSLCDIYIFGNFGSLLYPNELYPVHIIC